VEREVKTIEINSSWLATLGVVVACFFAVVFLYRDAAHLILQNPEPIRPVTWLRWVELGIFVVAIWITSEFLRQPHSRALKFAVVFFLVELGLKLLFEFGLIPPGLLSLVEITHLLTKISALIFLLVFFGTWFREKVKVV
jgi:hypothetical protein